MDPHDKIKELEAHIQKLGEDVAAEQVRREEAEIQIGILNGAIMERAQAIAEDQLEDYKEEAQRYVEALQIISDGKGKYAKIARDAL